MKLTDSEIRAAYQMRTARPAGQRHGCLTSEQLYDLWSGHLSAKDRAGWSAHLLACAECSREMQAIRGVDPVRASAAAVESLPSRLGRVFSAPFLLPQPSWRLAAFFACVAFGVVFLILSRQPGGVFVGAVQHDRGGGAPIAPVQPPDRATLASPPDILDWSDITGAEAYQVVLFDSESSAIWRSARLSASEAVLPEEVIRHLQVGRLYYWRVTAFVGLERQESALYEFGMKDGGREK